jgi:outer membrane biosynthesis protein TonB
MNKLESIAAIFLLLSPGCWAQQQASAPSQTPAHSIKRDSHSTPEDLTVPSCSASSSDGLTTIGNAGSRDVLPPKPVRTPEARVTKESLQAHEKNHTSHFEADIDIVVGTDGIPQDACLKKSAGYGLDAVAAKAVLDSRFEPATKDKKPVPVHVTVRVNYKIK